MAFQTAASVFAFLKQQKVIRTKSAEVNSTGERAQREESSFTGDHVSESLYDSSSDTITYIAPNNSSGFLSDTADAGLLCSESDSDLNEAVAAMKNRKRARSQESRALRDQKKHPLRPACPTRCRLKCTLKIDQAQREEINTAFWTLDYTTRKHFAAQRIERSLPDRHRPRTRCPFEGRRARNETRKYTMLDRAGESVQVCKTFFLNTLGLSSDRFITTLCATTSPGSATPPPDKRGRHAPSNKTSITVLESVNQHIESFHPTVAHYRRSHAPYRRYLPDEITITSMWKDFKEKNSSMEVSFQFYRRCVRNKNISFCKLGEEQCELCLQYDTQCHGHKEQSGKPCDMCAEWSSHIEDARKARAQYQEDGKSSSETQEGAKTVYLSSDMQKIVLLPIIPGVKTCVFTRRLVVFHQTFAPLGHLKSKRREGRVLACLWHEGIAGRNAADVACCYEQAVTYYGQSADSIVIWCDNCGPQNKNWTLYTCLTCLVNSSINVNSIELRYLEKGHTFMSADSFHASVEKKIRQTKNVWNFDDLCDTIETAAGFPKVNIMDRTKFRDWKKGVSYKKEVKARPQLKHIKAVKFTTGCRLLQYKLDLSDVEFKQCAFLKEEFLSGQTTLPPIRQSDRGVEGSKAAEIVKKLCPLMPPSKQGFWTRLRAADNIDLQLESCEVCDCSDSDTTDDESPTGTDPGHLSTGRVPVPESSSSAPGPPPSPRSSYPQYEAIDPGLAEDDRQMEYIQGGGNCFFQARSKKMGGDEDNHAGFITGAILCSQHAQDTCFSPSSSHIPLDDPSQCSVGNPGSARQSQGSSAPPTRPSNLSLEPVPPDFQFLQRTHCEQLAFPTSTPFLNAPDSGNTFPQVPPSSQQGRPTDASRTPISVSPCTPHRSVSRQTPSVSATDKSGTPPPVPPSTPHLSFTDQGTTGSVDPSRTPHQSTTDPCTNPPPVPPQTPQVSITVELESCKRINTNPDGRCFFRSCVIAQNGILQMVPRDKHGLALDPILKIQEQVQADGLRAKTIAWALEHLSEFEDIAAAVNFDMPSSRQFSSLQERLFAMSSPTECVGETEIACAAEVLRTPVYVMHAQTGTLLKYKDNAFSSITPIIVLYTGYGDNSGHYDCLVPTSVHSNAIDVLQNRAKPRNSKEITSRKTGSEIVTSPYKQSLKTSFAHKKASQLKRRTKKHTKSSATNNRCAV